jgi:CBS domain-containing protein
MRQLPQIIGADCTAQAAAERMAVDNIGFLVVGDEHHLDGVITDRDIVVRCVATGKDAALTPVRDIMSISVLACRPSEMVGDVIGRMMEAGITRLPVVNRKGQLVGIVSARDSVRSVPMSKVARRRALEVRFVKEVTASQGQVRRVSVQSVYVSGIAEHQRAKDEAIERFQHDQRVEDWTQAADDVEIKKQ